MMFLHYTVCLLVQRDRLYHFIVRRISLNGSQWILDREKHLVVDLFPGVDLTLVHPVILPGGVLYCEVPVRGCQARSVHLENSNTGVGAEGEVTH